VTPDDVLEEELASTTIENGLFAVQDEAPGKASASGREKQAMTSLHDSGRSTTIRRVAVYARVSTTEQTTEKMLLELRRYVAQAG
jgi:predicted site-specific integrase-resolvase